MKCIGYDQNIPNIIATGSRDGAIHIWDLRFENKVDSTGTKLSVPFRSNLNAHFVHNKLGKTRKSTTHSSITSILFRNSNYLYSSGASDGKIKKWDLRSTLKRPVDEHNHGGPKNIGICSMQFSPDYSRLYANYTNSKY